MLRVLVVDDDDSWALALQTALEQGDRALTVVGRAANGREAVALAVSLRPDVVTMDLDMPLMDGVEATRSIAALGTDVVMVMGSLSSERVSRAVAAGAVAAVAKTDAVDTLGAVLRSVVELARARRAAQDGGQQLLRNVARP
jgi:DNA-binding NarL/FixJ family response regulator